MKGDSDMTDKEARKIMTIAQTAYIQIMGIEKWNSLTEQEQHDALMILLKDLSNSIK